MSLKALLSRHGFLSTPPKVSFRSIRLLLVSGEVRVVREAKNGFEPSNLVF